MQPLTKTAVWLSSPVAKINSNWTQEIVAGQKKKPRYSVETPWFPEYYIGWIGICNCGQKTSIAYVVEYKCLRWTNPPIFGSSANPIPTGGGHIIPTYYYWPIPIFFHLPASLQECSCRVVRRGFSSLQNLGVQLTLIQPRGRIIPATLLHNCTLPIF